MKSPNKGTDEDQAVNGCHQTSCPSDCSQQRVWFLENVSYASSKMLTETDDSRTTMLMVTCHCLRKTERKSKDGSSNNESEKDDKSKMMSGRQRFLWRFGKKRETMKKQLTAMLR